MATRSTAKAATTKMVSRRKAAPVAPPQTATKVTAKLFRNGRSQAVRLPKEFQFEGKEVRVSRTADGAVLLESIQDKPTDWETFFAKMDAYRDLEVIPGGRNQPTLEPEDIFPLEWDSQ